ncbi:hypothetical protein Syun_001230 [Stephania yunnanensis]|uniref:Nucleoside diphosphate kinase-like domain-containing protein n=1 Tax=Stephania yunnanensis TaxID=152371 RepID=A0AAP0Q6A0_9MAGN
METQQERVLCLNVVPPVHTSIRALCGTDITLNCVHGSDSHKSASREIAFFFGTMLEHIKLVEENNGLHLEKQKLAEEASYAKDLKREISKARIKMLEPFIKGPAGLDYLGKAFTDHYGQLESTSTSLPLTRSWLPLVWHTAEQEWKYYLDSLSVQTTTHGSSIHGFPLTTLRAGGIVSSDEAIETAKLIALKKGCNIPYGDATAAIKVAKRPKNERKLIVVSWFFLEVLDKASPGSVNLKHASKPSRYHELEQLSKEVQLIRGENENFNMKAETMTIEEVKRQRSKATLANHGERYTRRAAAAPDDRASHRLRSDDELRIGAAPEIRH